VFGAAPPIHPPLHSDSFGIFFMGSLARNELWNRPAFLFLFSHRSEKVNLNFVHFFSSSLFDSDCSDFLFEILFMWHTEKAGV